MKQTSLKNSLLDKTSWSKQWAKVIFQYRFQSNLSTFELWLLPNYCELFNYTWLTYVKLIIRVGNQNLLTSTKCDVYSTTCPLIPKFMLLISLTKKKKKKNIIFFAFSLNFITILLVVTFLKLFGKIASWGLRLEFNNKTRVFKT